MKKVLVFAFAVIALTAAAAGAQMMGGGMMGGSQAPPPQQQPAQPPQGYGMYPGGMMGYGYPNMMGTGMVGPGMMGYGGYPNMMAPGMMGYGYPNMMGTGMMGYGGYPNMMAPGMMGGGMMGYGYPNMMGPGMMGYGGYGMMGYGTTPCATYPGAAGCPAAPGAAAQKKFLDDTAEPRRKLHTLMFDYMELARDPKADQAKVEALTRQIQDLQKTISEKWQEAAK